tara:strand:+ start:103 stop:219 length:117 start_codon:yes stop_codon:yes gene_type:complete
MILFLSVTVSTKAIARLFDEVLLVITLNIFSEEKALEV